MNETLNAQKPPGSASAICSPVIALSVRQPWAWLIVNGFKDIENRTWPTKFRGEVLIHAGKAMTRADHEACLLYCRSIGRLGHFYPAINKSLIIPHYDDSDLLRGGIVGKTTIVDCVDNSDSQWFCGDWGFVLRRSEVLPFRACKGALGFFNPGNEKLSDAGGNL